MSKEGVVSQKARELRLIRRHSTTDIARNLTRLRERRNRNDDMWRNYSDGDDKEDPKDELSTSVLSKLLLSHSAMESSPANIRQTAQCVNERFSLDLLKRSPLRIHIEPYVSPETLFYGMANGGVVIVIRRQSTGSEMNAETGSTDTKSHSPTPSCSSPILGYQMTRRVIDRKRTIWGHGNPFYSRGTRYRPDAEDEHIDFERHLY